MIKLSCKSVFRADSIDVAGTVMEEENRALVCWPELQRVFMLGVGVYSKAEHDSMDSQWLCGYMQKTKPAQIPAWMGMGLRKPQLWLRSHW